MPPPPGMDTAQGGMGPAAMPGPAMAAPRLGSLKNLRMMMQKRGMRPGY